MPQGNQVSHAELEDVYIASHPTRHMILKVLQSAEPNRLYVQKITDQLETKGLSVDRKIVAYHLSTLLEHDFVKGELELKNPPKGNTVAVKYFSLKEKGKKILSLITIK